VTPQLLVDQLLNRSNHSLAYHLCEHLNMDSQKVLIHWATLKLSSSETNEKIAESMKSNFKGKSISYSYLAELALELKKKEVAILVY
jgi:hypothetical protein